MYIVQCDRCQVLDTPKRDTVASKGWRRIGYNVKASSYSPFVPFHLCPACVTALKLPEDKEESLADRFLELLSELVSEAVEQQ